MTYSLFFTMSLMFKKLFKNLEKHLPVFHPSLKLIKLYQTWPIEVVTTDNVFALTVQ